MKLMDYRDIESQKFDVEGWVKGVTGRVAIGRNVGDSVLTFICLIPAGAPEI